MAVATCGAERKIKQRREKKDQKNKTKEEKKKIRSFEFEVQ